MHILPSFDRLTLTTGVNPNRWEIDDRLTQEYRSLARENGVAFSEEYEVKRKRRQRGAKSDINLFKNGKQMSALDTRGKIRDYFKSHTQTEDQPAAAASSAPSPTPSSWQDKVAKMAREHPKERTDLHNRKGSKPGNLVIRKREHKPPHPKQDEYDFPLTFDPKEVPAKGPPKDTPS